MAITPYPPVAFYFGVVIGNLGQVGFQEVSGISTEVQTEQVKEGGVNEYVHKLPKEVKYNNLVLKRGLVKNYPIIKWIKKAVEEFTFEPKMIEVRLLNSKGDILENWAFQNAYPVKFTISDFNAQEGKMVIETLELAYSYFTRKVP